MSDELVHLTVSGGVGTITLDSPTNRNALSRRLLAELEAHLTTALADPLVRVIVLTGAGPVFCSGADLKERRQSDAPAPGAATQRRGLAPILTLMWESPKPIVGRINGAARAGGLGLVAACDIAVAPENATFAITEVRIGVTPAIVAVVLLPKLGEARAMELFLTGDTFDAKAAVAHGLLSAAAPDGQLDEVVGRYVTSLLKGAPGAMAATKRLVRDLPGKPSMEVAFRDMAEISERYFASDEAREGMTAFAEKRPPRWAAGG
jgi:methylglutaconyl-CoA hydratase